MVFVVLPVIIVQFSNLQLQTDSTLERYAIYNLFTMLSRLRISYGFTLFSFYFLCLVITTCGFV